MPKKSAAKIRRLMKRAEERGETYVLPPGEIKETESEGVSKKEEKERKLKLAVARQIKAELDCAEKDESLNSKQRRSVKRKADAIATEKAGCTATELLGWYEQQDDAGNTEDIPMRESKRSKKETVVNKTPYILFVGQLSFDTTAESLLKHLQSEMSDSKSDDFKVRLLTHKETKKSRGMAFVEVKSPELLYACLKMHHSELEGRRINVERSAGGGRKSESRKSKIQQYRQEQEDHMASVVKEIIGGYQQNGEIKEGELDDGAVSLCARHSATVVRAALERYVESNGRDMDNPSAYLSFLLGKLAKEGIFESDFTDNKNSKNDRKKRFTGR